MNAKLLNDGEAIAMKRKKYPQDLRQIIE